MEQLWTEATSASDTEAVSAAADQEMIIEDERANVRFNALRNALYHTARRRSFERWNRVFNFLIILLGTAAVGGVLGDTGIGPLYIGAAVAVIGALQLVFDLGGQARLHQTHQRDYYGILADTDACIDATISDIGSWRSRMTRIAADEPPVLRAIDAKAFNDAIGALEIDESERVHIPFLHRRLGGIFAFEGHHYEKLVERA